MKNTILGLGAVASAAAVMALFGTATAAADYEGETYADASDAMSEAGVDPIVATRVGDKLDAGRLHRHLCVECAVPAGRRRRVRARR